MAFKVWFITGTSRGLGRVWAQAALARGDKVVATARSVESLAPLVARYGDAVLPLTLDVADRDAVFAAIDTAMAHFGRLDVVVSNAGYALFGTIEESSEPQARAQFDTNLFGTLWVIQAALPHLRAQGRGHVLVTSSVAGVITFPTAGVYNATKWAVEGLTETLASEVGAFGIKVTLVEPGGYDTDWRGDSAISAEPLPAYEELRQKIKAMSANRVLGHPAATASAILAVVDAEAPPLRLFLGKAGLPAAKQAYAQRMSTWEAWSAISEEAQGAA
ncbi:SDR family NAD(P)-dependent oxidoreductase [Variovorax sp. EL159]|uniref:SDR family NAD(P)-dependent oxidoreductase n=1 Tax=Variovorax sp. EL159 TaxID=1566270 RepID=UPI000890447D|nr:SDR family NAD(P)-dependent oxidoreductase [Variovorax sp. EL159]SCX65877.1 NADP-dependent 3-hydroxy acid dehydrogenase YdfG [Variovorax sp. EL159]